MNIIDMSAGNRAVWFNKKHPDCIYIDIRESVNPDRVCDSRATGMNAGHFDLVVFDPPHVNLGEKSDMARTYGHFTTVEIRDIIRRTSQEAHRISKPEALMAFKWNDHSQKLEKVLALMPEWEPLFGHKTASRTKHSSSTVWVMLKRRGELK